MRKNSSDSRFRDRIAVKVMVDGKASFSRRLVNLSTRLLEHALAGSGHDPEFVRRVRSGQFTCFLVGELALRKNEKDTRRLLYDVGTKLWRALESGNGPPEASDSPASPRIRLQLTNRARKLHDRQMSVERERHRASLKRGKAVGRSSSTECSEALEGTLPSFEIAPGIVPDGAGEKVELLKAQLSALSQAERLHVVQYLVSTLDVELLDPRDLATVNATAELLGLTKRSIQQQIEVGRIKTVSLADGRQMVRVSECRAIWKNGPLTPGDRISS